MFPNLYAESVQWSKLARFMRPPREKFCRKGDASAETTSGKSSITDAIEWVIWDRVAHLWREDCKESALRNVDLEDTEEVLMTHDQIEDAIRRGEFALTTQVAAFALATHPAFAK